MLIIAPVIWVLAGIRLAGIFGALLTLPNRRLNASLALGLLLVLFVTAGLPVVDQIRPEIVKRFEGKPYYSALEALALHWRAALEARRSTWQLDIDQYPYDWYERMIYRHNRKPQANILISDFSSSSLSEVIGEGHYASVIALRNQGKKVSTLGEGTLPELLPYPAQTYRLQDWEVTVYDLR